MSADTAVQLISTEEVRQALITAVGTNPKRVDKATVNEVTPRYLNRDGTPASLVAYVLLELGFTESLLRQLDSEFALGEVVRPGVRLMQSRNPAMACFMPETMALFEFLQRCQDFGLSWGDTYSEAYARPFKLLPTRFTKSRRPWLY